MVVITCLVASTVILAVVFYLYDRMVVPVLRCFRGREKLKKKYSLAFERRDALMYHIGAAKQRGDVADAKSMLQELDDVDRQIDLLEADICTSFWDYVWHNLTAAQKDGKPSPGGSKATARTA